ncbi:MAG: septum formation initiator family protein [Polyangia bacterium]
MPGAPQKSPAPPRRKAARARAESLRGAVLWTIRLTLAAGLAVLLGYLPYKLYLRSGLSQYVSLKAELARLIATNEELRQQNSDLRAQLARIQEDDSEIERVARDELGLLRIGELVFKVSPED